MTIGAKRLPIFEVPRGWIRNSRMRMPQLDPTMVDLLMSGWTTSNLFCQLANDTRESQKRDSQRRARCMSFRFVAGSPYHGIGITKKKECTYP